MKTKRYADVNREDPDKDFGGKAQLKGINPTAKEESTDKCGFGMPMRKVDGRINHFETSLPQHQQETLLARFFGPNRQVSLRPDFDSEIFGGCGFLEKRNLTAFNVFFFGRFVLMEELVSGSCELISTESPCEIFHLKR